MRKTIWKRLISSMLALAMVLSLASQFVMPTAKAAEEIPVFGTTNSDDSFNTSTGKATSCTGKAVVALYHNGDTFPGEPDNHDGAGYVKYNNSFQPVGSNTTAFFSASEILQGEKVINSSDYVVGENNAFTRISGIFDPNGLDDEYFTENFRIALKAHETDMIEDVLEAKGLTDANPADYEIVWYVIKYQRIWYIIGSSNDWHINGLIREKDKYSITYSGNGNTAGSPPSGTIDMSYSAAKAYTVSGNTNGLERSDSTGEYDFIGWNTKADGSGTFYTAGQTADLTTLGQTSITLYAQWKEKDKVTITWKDGNGNTVHMDTLTQGSKTTYDGPNPTQLPDSNWTYTWKNDNNAWNTKADGTGTGYARDAEITANGNITLYAQFTSKTRTYTVTWVNHTVIETDSGISYGGSAEYNGATPVRSTTETEGYLFAGWSTTENGTVEYGLRDAVPVTTDTTLYAQFTLVPMRTVNWYNEDGSVLLETERALEGSVVTYDSATPSKAGHKFLGWAASVGGTVICTPGASVTVKGDEYGNMDLYACFTPETYTVIWKNDNDSVLETDYNVPYGSTPTYNGAVPTKASSAQYTYTFIGWEPDVNTVTGDITYTAKYIESTRAYTVIWKNYDGSVLKSEQINHGVKPDYTGETPVCPETVTHSHKFIGWTPTISTVPNNADGTGVIIYTATFEEVPKYFTATVKVWKDPTIDSDTGAVTDGTLVNLNDLVSYGALYLRDLADNSKIVELKNTSAGTYTASLPHGNYDVVVSDGAGGYTRIIEERVALPLDTMSSDPDSTTADIIFYSVTYDFNGGMVDGQSSKVEYYQRGTDVTVSGYTPTRNQYIFDNWQLDDGTDTYVKDQRITVLGGGIIKPHMLTAKWIRANDKVNINLTIHHHADPVLSGAIGMNPEMSKSSPQLPVLNLDLTYRPEGSSGDYWEEGKKHSSSDWYSSGTITEGTAVYGNDTYNTKTTNITFSADTTGFKSLSHVWDYSANILLEDYFLTARTVTPTADNGAEVVIASDGNITYKTSGLPYTGDITYIVNATLQYRPDLFNMSYTVEIDESVPDELVPTAVDLKILSYKDSTWSPISRHQSTSVEARFTDRNSVSGSYGVPVDYYYRVAVVGFTLPNGTELSASDGTLKFVDYKSDATGSTDVYSYAAGAYTAVVTVENGADAIGGVPAVYGSGNATEGYAQTGTVTVTVYSNAHTVTFDPNGGSLPMEVVNPAHNQFRIPVLGNYIPSREGNYVFDGWYFADSEGSMTNNAAVSRAAITKDETLVAKWKEPLRVGGEVRLNTHYTLDGNVVAIPDYELPGKLTVTLERETQSGDKIIVQVKEISSIDYTTYAANYLGFAEYAFDPVPQDGSSYRVYVAAANYETKFLNEPEANESDKILVYEIYDFDHSAVDDDRDNDATVYAALTFAPATYALTWEVDSSAIAESFRPQTLGILVQYNANNGTPNYADWPVISQHHNNGSYHPETTELNAATVTDSFPVWQTHTGGEAYDYAVRVHEWNDTAYNNVAAPFTVTYGPAVAWYEGGKQITANSTEDNLGITLTPKTYTITYDLSAGGDTVSGFVNAPETHIWSKTTIGIPTNLTRVGYDFTGWTCNVDGAYSNGTVSAGTAQNITLTAQWKQQKKVTFQVVNGTWSDATTADIVSYVSLDGNGKGTVTVPTGMNPLYGYGNGSWSDASLNGQNSHTFDNADVTPVTYTYTFQRKTVTVTYSADDPASDSPKTGQTDTMFYGNYIRVEPNGGSLTYNEATYQVTTDFKMEADATLPNPTRTGYIFAGWALHYENDDIHGGGIVTRRYAAQWLADANNDKKPDIYQKKVTFQVVNGTWNGTSSEPITHYVDLTNNQANISSLIPSGMRPNAGFISDGAFWSPSEPPATVSGSADAVYTYYHYTVVHYSDYDRNMAASDHLILPGTIITVNYNDDTTATKTETVLAEYSLPDLTRDTYTFRGWDREGNVFTAQWSLNEYTVTWKDFNGTTLETDENVDHGTAPIYNSTTLAKPANDQYTYTFAGWFVDTDGDNTLDDGESFYAAGTTLPAVTANVTYTAHYSSVVNQYTVEWQNEDGSRIGDIQTKEYNSAPVVPETLAKSNTAQYSYTFAGWKDLTSGMVYAAGEIPTVTKNVVYRATFNSTINKYTVTFLQEDGTTQIQAYELDYGALPVAPAAPEKTDTAEFNYTFVGWTDTATGEPYLPGSLPTVIGKVTYKATYTAVKNKYTVTWLNYNNVTLETDTLVEYGTTPSFDSNSKLTTEDANHDYKFLGWYLSTDESKTLVSFEGENAQKVEDNVTYIAKYSTTPKSRAVTANVWLNATAADGTNGTRIDIGTATNGLRGNLYLVPEGSVGAYSTYVEAEWNADTKVYTTSLKPGNYLLYAGGSAETAEREATQIVAVVNADVSVNTLYNSVTYNAGDGSFADGKKIYTEYFKSGTSPVYITETVPSRSDYVFTHWHDAESNTYNASTQAVPVKLIDSIQRGYTLTAHWSDAADIQVIVNIDTVDENGQSDTGFADKKLSLQLAGKANGSDSSVPYVAIYGTDISNQYSSSDNAWTVNGGVYTFTKTYANQRGDYVYQATALMKNYALTSISVDGNTITIDLKYDPAGFDLEFEVVVDSNVPDDLVPRAVDVQIVFFDRETSTWKMLSNTQNKALEVTLNKDSEGTWSGTGSYHVWSKYTTGTYANQLYLYRIAVTDFDLGTNRGSLTASSTDFKIYSSAAGNYHPAGAYTATVSVSDSDCNLGTAGNLNGAHVYRNGTTDEQHGTITATVSVNPYAVVQHYNDGTTADKTTKAFIMPALDTPTYAGHTFAGWWTKDGEGNWGTQITTAGTAVMSLVSSGTTLDLYARWIPDLVVKGDITVSNMFDGKVIDKDDRPNTVTVELLNATTGAVLQSIEVTLSDVVGEGETADTARTRAGMYEFEGVPNNGAVYRATVAVPNFDLKYRNEEATGTEYSTDMYTAVDKDANSVAKVDIYLDFNPHNFDLEYTVDASAIGEKYRPDKAGIVVLSGDASIDPQQWDIVVQQKQNGGVDAHEIEIGDDGRAKADTGSNGIWHKFSVWRRNSSGELYEYAIQLWSLKHGETNYSKTDIETAPFTVIYSPTRAWYDSTTGKQATPPSILSSGAQLTHPDSTNPNGLVAYIVPRSYTVTYELGQSGTVGTVTSIDGDTAQSTFRWSHGLSSLPTANAVADGVEFAGWWTKDGEGNWDTQVTSIKADVMENMTLYARWNYTVTWDSANGSAPTSVSVLEGTTPTHAAPSKTATAQYTYTFAGWSPSVSAVTGNVTYTATYDQAVNKYTVTWKNGENILETDSDVAYGTLPQYNGATPTKTGNAQYSYSFAGWSPSVSTITGHTIYTAQFTETVNKYTITWLDGDGKVLSSKFVAYGETPSYSGATPTKSATAQYTYTFNDTWSPDIVSVVGNATYTAQFNSTVKTYTITWVNEDGTVLETDENVPYDTTPTFDKGADPTKAADAQYIYTFKGWDTQVVPVAGPTTYKATYTPVLRTYSVVWKNHDDTTLKTDENVPYGTVPVYSGTAPAKTATAQYTYTHSGWTPSVVAVTGNAEYTATFAQKVNKYTVKWVNDGGTVLETDENVDYGRTPTYDGVTPAKTDPSGQYTYTFTGWTPTVSTVTGDKTYTATYSSTVNKYTVTWKNWNGEILEVDNGVEYGTTPKYGDNGGTTPAKATTVQYTYTFSGWSPAISDVTGDVIYVAQFGSTVNKYKVTWYDDDGTTVLETDFADYGHTPSFNQAGGTAGLAAAKNDAQYTYTFDGWHVKGDAKTDLVDLSQQTVTGEISYQAKYTRTTNTYTVTWKNENGTVLETDASVLYNSTAEYNGNTPAKESTAEYNYVFAGWSPAYTTVTGDVTYTAQYEPVLRSYTVTWLKDDGTLLGTTTVEYGSKPTRVDPVKVADAQYTYTFVGWKKDGTDTAHPVENLDPVTGDVTYRAAYSTTVNRYTVTWINYDGDVLETDTNVEYGTVPEYNNHGGTTAELAAARTTAQVTFTFDKWDHSLTETIKGDTTIQALFTSTATPYTITWKYIVGSTEKTVSETHYYGDKPTFPGGEDPSKVSTVAKVYEFIGWKKDGDSTLYQSNALAVVTDSFTYVAQFEESDRAYTITWRNEDGTRIDTTTVNYGEVPTYAAPSKAATAEYTYTFTGWTPSVVAVTGDAEYRATFLETKNKYTVTWKDADGTELEKDTDAEFGTTPSFDRNGGTAALASAKNDAQYTYSFTGWNPSPALVVGDATYTATYDRTVNTFTVIWKNWDGAEMEKDTDVPYGTPPSFGGTVPSRPETTEHSYTFDGWLSSINGETYSSAELNNHPVTRNVIFTAVFTDRTQTYTVTWKNWDGSVLETDENVPYGTIPSCGVTPTKTGNDQYSYTHNGWSPTISSVVGNVEYTATYTQTVNKYTITYTDGVSGTEVFADNVHSNVPYGSATPVFSGTPSRPGYTFVGWSPAVVDTVIGNATYTAQWQVINTPIPNVPTTGTVVLTKVDANDHSTVLPGVIFNLYRADGTKVGTYTTDSYGQVVVNDLVPGAYYWLETRPAAGYKMDYTKHTVTVRAGRTRFITVENHHSTVPDVFSGEHYAYTIGFPDGLVHPERSITRAEVATIFFRMLAETTRTQNLTQVNSFSDVSQDDWFNTAVSTMAALGVINGYPDGTLRPNEPIKRAEFAALAARFELHGDTTNADFSDIYGHWAQKEINVAYNNGWVLGYEDGTFQPDRDITRAEAMTLVNRVLQRVPQSAADLLPGMKTFPDNMDTSTWYYLAVQEASNSHDYVRKNSGFETWTELTEAPDWKQFE